MKTKRILTIIIVFAMCFALVSCASATATTSTKPEEQQLPVPESFILINSNSIAGGIRQYIMYDPETLVMYSLFYISDNGCSVTVMYNVDGTLKLYTPHIEANE